MKMEKNLNFINKKFYEFFYKFKIIQNKSINLLIQIKGKKSKYLLTSKNLEIEEII